ncbi:MAG TPA: hypothetical protein VIO94_00370 [Phenylobacterium sp.]
MAAQPPPAVVHWDGPGLDAWRAWTPAEAAEVLADLNIPWAVAGGWAIDLWLGRVTRAHEDLEIAILRPDFPAIRRRLAGFGLYTVGDGEVRRLEPTQEPPADKHQNWVLDEAAQAWRMDVFLEGGDAQTWVFRRDRAITAPRHAVVGRTAEGIPYLRPETVLLFKAKMARDKDEADFGQCLPRLEAPARAWLRTALERAHPQHAWIDRLNA